MEKDESSTYAVVFNNKLPSSYLNSIHLKENLHNFNYLLELPTTDE